jgi:hypothetical protein
VSSSSTRTVVDRGCGLKKRNEKRGKNRFTQFGRTNPISNGGFRQCLLELCAIDRLLTSHGARRDRALQHITILREIKARRPQLASKSAGGNGSVRRLKQVKNNERAAANS